MLIAFLSVLLLFKHTFSFYSKKTKQTKSLSTNSTNKQIEKMSNFITKSNDNQTLSSSSSSNVIVFKAGDKQQCYEISDSNVTIVGSAGSHDHGSSKVKLKNIVDYKWEAKNYPGHLIAVHIDGKHIAYVINVNNKISRTEGMVRVVNATTGLRALIKGMSGEVLDLQFAHIETDRILASIDANSLYVHKIDMSGDTLFCNLLIKIEDPLSNYTPKYDKISWCPYVDCSSDDDEESNQLIVWARGSIYQCFNVNTININYGIGKFSPSDIATGYLKFYEPTLMITWVTLSPDGTTLGVGGEDGVVRFYQVYFHEKERRCLHQWKPHGGRPVSSFFFLDNLTKSSADSYWKYALTGAEDNTEFKIWDCGTWQCLQTITLKTSEDKKLKFIAEIDRTSSYLVISNLETRVMYVLQIITAPDGAPSLDQPINMNSSGTVAHNSTNSVNSTDNDHQVKKKTVGVYVKSVSEFPLSSPILSFSIVDAAVRRYKCANDNYLLDEMDEYDEETNSIYCVVLRMFIVQPKSVQECHILYQPTVDENTEVKSISNDSSIKEFIENVSEKSNDKDMDDVAVKAISTNEKGPLEGLFDRVANAQANVDKTDSPNPSPQMSTTSSHKSFTQVNLMTPDAFISSTGKKSPEVSSEVLNTILMLASVTGTNSAANKPDNMNLLNLVNNKIIEDQEQQKMKQSMETQKKFMAIENSNNRNNVENLTSGNSSPSREVQEIMSLQDFHCDKSPYSSDEIDQGKPENGRSSKVLNKLPEKQTEAEKKPPSSISTNWPKVPDVRTVTKHSTELQNSENLITQPNNDLSDMNMKMDQILDLVQKQSLQISALQNEINELKAGTYKDMESFSFKVEMQLSKLMEQYLKRYENEHKKKLSTFLAGKEAQNRELVQLLHQFTHTHLSEVISKVVTVEIQRQMMPLLVTKIDGLQTYIQKDVTKKLAAFDMMLKENIAHVCKSKNIIDAFGKSVLVGVQGSLQAAFIESMSSTLIPAYEKSSQNMFKQLHEAFSVGIKEFMEQFDNYLSHLQPMQDSTEEILNKFSGFRQHLDSILIKHRNTVQESMVDTKKDIKHMEMQLSRQIAEVVRNEVRKGFESQTVALRSQTTTPAPSIYDIKDQIKLLLSTSQINKAFHQALLANDLTLVEFTLNRADHNAVFHPCCLEQKVLLSLIQQISADMSNHNEVKQNYLADAILSINPNDPITREHAPKVMQELYRNCQAFLRTQTKNPQCSNVRMLMKAIQGLSTEKIY